MSLFIGITCLVVGFALGWYGYKKFGAKAQAAEIAIADSLKK